jgi:hypothetical protein
MTSSLDDKLFSLRSANDFSEFDSLIHKIRELVSKTSNEVQQHVEKE